MHYARGEVVGKVLGQNLFVHLKITQKYKGG